MSFHVYRDGKANLDKGQYFILQYNTKRYPIHPDFFLLLVSLNTTMSSVKRTLLRIVVTPVMVKAKFVAEAITT